MTKPKKDLYEKLEAYRGKREAEKEYKRTLFYVVPLGFSRSVKLSAVNKMLDDMNGKVVKYNPDELDALRQGRLGLIVGKPKYCKELPICFCLAETALRYQFRDPVEYALAYCQYGR